MNIDTNPFNLPPDELETLAAAARILAKHTGQGNEELSKRFGMMVNNQAIITQARSKASEQPMQLYAAITVVIFHVCQRLAAGDDKPLLWLFAKLKEISALNRAMGATEFHLDFAYEPDRPKEQNRSM